MKKTPLEAFQKEAIDNQEKTIIVQEEMIANLERRISLYETVIANKDKIIAIQEKQITLLKNALELLFKGEEIEL